jgi:hypothetical protein
MLLLLLAKENVNLSLPGSQAAAASPNPGVLFRWERVMQRSCVLAGIILMSALGAARAEGESDLAKKLANPVSSLISVPFQFNYDKGYGVNDGGRTTLNIQPVVPVKLNQDWNVIVRTIVPLTNQEPTVPGGSNQFGMGDTTQSFFFSPSQSVNGVVWGLGPVFLWPTGTNPALRSEKVGAGPTGVLLKQEHGWTYGILANHIWSFAGSSSRPDISNTFLQPFVNYTFPDTFGITLNTESTYDWVTHQWTVPVNLISAASSRSGHSRSAFRPARATMSRRLRTDPAGVRVSTPRCCFPQTEEVYDEFIS